MTATPPGSVVLVIGSSIERAQIPLLCERVGRLAEDGDIDRVVCDVGAIASPDAVTVDALARIQLTARRLGCRFLLYEANDELVDLLAFMGLRDVLPCGKDSDLEPKGYAE